MLNKKKTYLDYYWTQTRLAMTLPPTLDTRANTLVPYHTARKIYFNNDGWRNIFRRPYGFFYLLWANMVNE